MLSPGIGVLSFGRRFKRRGRKDAKRNVGRRPVMSLVSNFTRRQDEGVQYECDILENRISDGIVGAGIEVHKRLGPGLLESAYAECLAHELATRGFVVAQGY
jgi:hypothetical protein